MRSNTSSLFHKKVLSSTERANFPSKQTVTMLACQNDSFPSREELTEFQSAEQHSYLACTNRTLTLTVLVTFPCTRPSTKSWALNSLTKLSRDSRERPSIKARYLSIIDQREYSRIKSRTSLQRAEKKKSYCKK